MHPGDRGGANTPDWVYRRGFRRSDHLIVHSPRLRKIDTYRWPSASSIASAIARATAARAGSAAISACAVRHSAVTGIRDGINQSPET